MRLESDAAALTARPLHVQQTMRVRWQSQSFSISDFCRRRGIRGSSRSTTAMIASSGSVSPNLAKKKKNSVPKPAQKLHQKMHKKSVHKNCAKKTVQKQKKTRKKKKKNEQNKLHKRNFYKQKPEQKQFFFKTLYKRIATKLHSVLFLRFVHVVRFACMCFCVCFVC